MDLMIKWVLTFVVCCLGGLCLVARQRNWLCKQPSERRAALIAGIAFLALAAMVSATANNEQRGCEYAYLTSTPNTGAYVVVNDGVPDYYDERIINLEFELNHRLISVSQSGGGYVNPYVAAISCTVKPFSRRAVEQYRWTRMEAVDRSPLLAINPFQCASVVRQGKEIRAEMADDFLDEVETIVADYVRQAERHMRRPSISEAEAYLQEQLGNWPTWYVNGGDQSIPLLVAKTNNWRP